jgi:hypothetical protein
MVPWWQDQLRASLISQLGTYHANLFRSSLDEIQASIDKIFINLGLFVQMKDPVLI